MTRRKLDNAAAAAAVAVLPQQPSTSSTATDTSSSPSNEASPSIMITVLILAIAVIIAASLYLLLRFLRRNRHSSSSSSAVLPHSLSTASEKSFTHLSPIIDALPLFTYNRLSTQHAGDCAVCLSKFENDDVLRLLPLCCHAFHAECIDTWLSTSLTCPLCRSPILLSESEFSGKITGGERSGSFRVEIGNVSNRQRGGDSVVSGEIRRSYSLGGSFDYVVSGDDDVLSDVQIPVPEYYKDTVSAEQLGVLAAEVGTTRGGGGSWLKDYLSYSLSLSSSRTASFRGSGRMFFTGSSRRSTVELNAVGNNQRNELDEANRLGDEISELFRWLSGN